MTRKDYVAIAKAFAEVEDNINPKLEYNCWYSCVSKIADVLQADNPDFDRLRFTFACSGGKKPPTSLNIN